MLRSKPVAVVGASTSRFGAVWAQAELRNVLAACGAHVLEADLRVAPAETRFDTAGRLHDIEVRRQLAEIVYALIDETTVRPAAA